MIIRLRGTIIEKQPPKVLLEIHGVGYEVYMPITCFGSLPEIGQEAVILTHYISREGVHLLFGFIHKQEQMLFRELIKVHGVGPKLALAILSEMSVKKFITAVKHQEIDSLVILPGIGKKIAKRLMIEMKDKFNDSFDDSHPLQHLEDSRLSAGLKRNLKTDSENEALAISALVSLGYKPQDAKRLIGKVISTSVSTNFELLIRNALRATL
ncbi:Holliday junction branch migration protein RuvA [Candidatus Curculioniphilus buchneri]|uniref:Holliday junction branch migration protein RuvA n=1 Tax=Candidatus Curculioniphilus buchneri TaxID=690594 RepID=UPI00376EE13A